MWAASVIVSASVYNVTSVTPNTGLTSGGTAIQIHGNGFEAPSQATMNFPPKVSLVEPNTGKEFECSSVQFVSEWQINCTTPAHPQAAMCIRVQLRSKGMEGNYTLCPAFTYK